MRHAQPDPLEELLRARLRMPEGGDVKLRLVLGAMKAVDGLSRVTTGQAFFALRETRETLIALDGKTGPPLLEMLLQMKGGTEITAIGLENVPAQGPVVIGATHPIGTFDFIAHAAAMRAHRPDLKVVAGREAERFLGPEMIVAVDMDRNDKVITARQTIRGMRAHLQTGGALLIFGSGRVPKMEQGLLVERAWRGGVTRISAECDAPIVPASANMRNSRHYYRTRALAAWLSGGNDDFGHRIASLRYISELFSKLGGSYAVHYGAAQPSGTDPERLKELAESLVPGLYVP